MTIPLLLVFVLLCGAWPAGAQPPVTRLDLDEAIARGLAHSARVADLEAREEAASAAVSGRRAAGLPVVAALAGYTRTNHVDEFGIIQPGQPPRILYPDVPDNYRARLDLQWPIFSGGRTDALVRAAEAERSAVSADLAAARADLRLEIARAFWALVTAREARAVVERSLEAMRAHVAALRSRFEQGLIPPNDVLSAEAEESRRRVLAIEAANAARIAEADLGRLVGIDVGLDDDGAIEPLAALTPPALPGPGTAADRPERLALSDRADAAAARADAAASAFRPQIALAAGYDVARPNPRIFPRADTWEPSWDLSVNVGWTLWDGGRHAADAAEASALARAASTRVTEFDRAVRFEVTQRRLELASSVEAIAAAADAVRAATEARRVVGERFAAGVATNTEVLDAEVAVLQAELERTRALANARLAEARYTRAAGRARP